MKGSQDRVAACTTTHFEGVIAIVDAESWVGRWQRIGEFSFVQGRVRGDAHAIFFLGWDVVLMGFCLAAKYVRGVYAVRVKGRVPEDVEAELESRGIKYRTRDQTEMD